MTAAHEATLAIEVKIPYALICMIDNMGHGKTIFLEFIASGLATEELSMEQFQAGFCFFLLSFLRERSSRE